MCGEEGETIRKNHEILNFSQLQMEDHCCSIDIEEMF